MMPRRDAAWSSPGRRGTIAGAAAVAATPRRGGRAMAGSMREISSNGGTVPAYVSVPPEGSGPGVVVIQEWWGLVPHIRNVADRMAAEGFVAIAPDLYRG